MTAFNRLYSLYYDLLYQSKNYLAESIYVSQLINENSKIKVNSILELGCGTGRHIEVWPTAIESYCGVDISPNMLELAQEKFKNKNFKFINQDVCELNLDDTKFSSVISLFHVASYQNSNANFLAYLKSANKNLDMNGTFVFDFWYGPAVLRDSPQIKFIERENDQIKMVRFTSPLFDFNNNLVNIEFKISVNDKMTGDTFETVEKHSMRYFFLPEIAMFAELAGFKVEVEEQWMESKRLSDKTWYGVVVLKKIKNIL